MCKQVVSATMLIKFNGHSCHIIFVGKIEGKDIITKKEIIEDILKVEIILVEEIKS